MCDTLFLSHIQICVFILDFNIPDKIWKYTIRSEKAVELDRDMKSSSLLNDILQEGTHIKYSDINKAVTFDPLLDGCPGIIVKNILATPLKEENSGRILGAVHFLNKYGGKVAFTELDEIFATVYAEMGVSALLGCQKLQHTTFRADVLTAILAAPSYLLHLLPGTLFMREILPFEVLKALEDSTRNALRCFKIKAFLISDKLKDVRKGFLLTVNDLVQTSVLSGKDSNSLKQISAHTGIAGFVIDSKKWVIQLAGEIDPRWHPDTDLEPLGMPCVTMPILNLQGDVIACIQMVLGHRSPKISLKDSRADGFDFEQAANYLAKSLSSPLQNVLDAMWDKEIKSKTQSQVQVPIACQGSVKNFSSECSVTVDQLVKEKLAAHHKQREDLGFVEIDPGVMADSKRQLEIIIKEREDYQRVISGLKRDLRAMQLFSTFDKKTNSTVISCDTETVEAKEIAGRIRGRYSHSRRRSFA